VPIGVPGELCIGGAGVARGYLKRPELTAEKFVADPFSARADARLYRTGDLARFLPDGNIEYLGRLDHQVKIRGFRIELGEIEAALTQLATVHAAAVLAREDEPGDKRLVAYVVPAAGAGAVTVAALRSQLAAVLPEYMIPGAVVSLDALPLNSSGKVDRKALPKPAEGRPELDVAFVTPATELERQIAEIWQGVLRVPAVGLHDNFFDLGGNSLLLLRVFDRLRKLVPAHAWTMVDLFRYPTLHGLARFLTSTSQPAQPALSDAQERGRRQRAMLTGARGPAGKRG
jgi:hypothetical protein